MWGGPPGTGVWAHVDWRRGLGKTHVHPLLGLGKCNPDLFLGVSQARIGVEEHVKENRGLQLLNALAILNRCRRALVEARH